MSGGGDDIERLLREVDAMGAGGSPTGGGQVQPSGRGVPTQEPGRSAARKGDDGKGSRGGRLAFAVVAAVSMGILGAFTGMFLGPVVGWLPLIDFGFWSTGLGAAFGGFVTGLVAGPPRWFSS